MNFPVSWAGDLAVVTAPEEIDMTNAASLRAALLSAAENDPPAIVVDLTATEFCDSTGLNVLVRAHKQLEQPGTELRLAVRAAAVNRILAVTGFAGMFRIYDSLADALRQE